MYIATHLGWVVLSCAVLMFFRKRSIKKKEKKKAKWNSSISLLSRSGTEPWAAPSWRMHQAWWRGRGKRSVGCPGREEPSPGAALRRFASVGFCVPNPKLDVAFLWLPVPASSPPPSRSSCAAGTALPSREVS